MKVGSKRFLELIECRVELLRTLIRTETEWRRAFIALNLREVERCTADQELVCQQIRTLDREIATLQAKSFEIDPSVDQQARTALDRTVALHLDLKRSNDTKRAILRRSKFTIDALHNLFNSHAPTYAAPAAHTVGTIYREIV